MRRLDIKVVPFECWSTADRAAWEGASRPQQKRSTRPSLARFPQQQQQALRAAFGRWLGFLRLQGHDPLHIRGADFLNEDKLYAFVTRLHARLSSSTVRTYMVNLEAVVRVMAPNIDLDDLHAFTRDACRSARAESDKRERVVPSSELLELGVDLMADAPQRNSTLGRARDFRDGLAIAILSVLPVRISNLTMIAIGRHLVINEGGAWFVFPSNSVKNRRLLELRLPPELLPWLATYLEQHRPRLLQQRGRWWRDPGEALWISDDGGPMGAKQMSTRISRRTRVRFQFPINPHLFRDCAATTIAVTDPAHVGIVTPVLGHSNHRTAERFYNQASGIEAGFAYQTALEQFLTAARGRPS